MPKRAASIADGKKPNATASMTSSIFMRCATALVRVRGRWLSSGREMCRSSWRCVFLDVGHLAERIPLKRAPLRERESPANGRASRAWTSSGARAARLGEPGAGPGLGPGAGAGGKLAWRINRFAGSAPRGVRDARRRLLRTDNTHVDLLVVDGIASFSLPLSSSFLFWEDRVP